LKVSVVFNLWGDGYSRGEENAKTKKFLGRFPYDRHSKFLLDALELGVLPAPEDLPDEQFCHYYDGCLIAQINDYREAVGNVPTSWKIILRPDYLSTLNSLDSFVDRYIVQENARLSRRVIKPKPFDKDLLLLEAEAKVLQRTHQLNLDPVHPRKTLENPWVKSFALFKVDKIPGPKPPRKIPRLSDARVHAPSLSSMALKLLAATEKRTIPKNKLKDPAASKAADSKPVPYGALLCSTPPDAVKAREPPQVAMRSNLDAIEPFDRHQKLRSMRLVFPSSNRAALPNNPDGTPAPAPPAPARPFYMLDVSRLPLHGHECVIWRGNVGEKHADISRVPLGNAARAQLFADQFRRLARSEGFFAVSDTEQRVPGKSAVASNAQQQGMQGARAENTDGPPGASVQAAGPAGVRPNQQQANPPSQPLIPRANIPPSIRASNPNTIQHNAYTSNLHRVWAAAAAAAAATGRSSTNPVQRSSLGAPPPQANGNMGALPPNLNMGGNYANGVGVSPPVNMTPSPNTQANRVKKSAGVINDGRMMNK